MIRVSQKFLFVAAIWTMLISAPAMSQTTISPYLFGQNHWLADGDEGRVGYLEELWQKVGQAGVTMVRIGGNGYERDFPNRPRLNKMIENIKSIGAEPLLQISRFSSTAQAAALVQYYTSGSALDVKYFSIGNEPMLNDEEKAEEVYDYVVRLATAMKKANPAISIFATDEAWLRVEAYQRFIGGDLDITGLKHDKTFLIDGITFHRYPNGAKFTRDDVLFGGPQGMRKNIELLVRMISDADRKYDRQGSAKLRWGLTEFHVTYSNPNREIAGIGNPSFIAGQFFAEIFSYGMEFEAFTMTPWCINEVDAVRTDFGFLGMPREFFPRSTYYHMQMLSQAAYRSFVKSQSSSKWVFPIVTTDGAQHAVMLLNKHESLAQPFSLSLGPLKADLKADLERPGSQVKIAIQSNRSAEAFYQGELPAQSTRVLMFDKDGKLVKTISYSLADNLKHAKPTVGFGVPAH
jgi:hypothetical protein